MIDLTPAAERMIRLFDGIDDDQLTGPTPCDDDDVGTIVDHVVVLAGGAVALARRDGDGLAAAGEPDREHLGPAWRVDGKSRLRALGEAWLAPAAWEGGGLVPGSDLSNETWGKIVLTELVVHGWDLAVATGQPIDLPEPTLAACLDHVAAFVPGATVPDLWGDPSRSIRMPSCSTASSPSPAGTRSGPPEPARPVHASMGHDPVDASTREHLRAGARPTKVR